MRRPNLEAWAPRYGTIRSLVVYLLLVVVVWRAEAPLRETAAALGVDRTTAWTGVLALLGLLFLVVLGFEYRRQTESATAFYTRDVRAKFFEQQVPTRALFAGYVLLLVAGGYVALFARGTFFTRLDNALLVVRRLLTSGDPGSFSLAALGYGLLFVVGAVAFAHAADRVLVAAWRKLVADRT